MKKIAIIGAAIFQLPAIIKAKEMGLETHVFAWAQGDEGEVIADYFYPISVRDKDLILEKCREIGIDGIISIASDLAMETVNYVASELGLVGNSMQATKTSTNKHLMRKAFELRGDPSPRSMVVDSSTKLDDIDIDFPLIVKPTDRSGSRGVRKVTDVSKLRDAVYRAREYSFEKKAVIEEWVGGDEYSIEYISFKGEHHFLSATQKITTREPFFIEKGHREPAPIDDKLLSRVKKISEHALDTLKLEYGASHIEIRIEGDKIVIIEIGGRMGGDFIGSDLVELSTGYDFVKAVIDVAMGSTPEFPMITKRNNVGINFIINADDLKEYESYKSLQDVMIIKEQIDSDLSDLVTDSSNRHGYYIFKY